LKFLRVIVPNENLHIPKTYKALLKFFDLPQVKTKRLCSKCSIELLDDTECTKPVCNRFKNNSKNFGKKDPIITEFNFVADLQQLLSKNWTVITAYRSQLNLNIITDICNSQYYKSLDLVLNSISLVLFIDGAQFNKSQNGSIWAVLGMISNLPPIIRCSFVNMLKILFINGRLFDFNGIFDNHMSAFKEMLANGVDIILANGTIKVMVYVHAVIADAPGRAKICYSKQHNGIYGCFHCLSKCHTQNGKK